MWAQEALGVPQASSDAPHYSAVQYKEHELGWHYGTQLNMHMAATTRVAVQIYRYLGYRWAVYANDYGYPWILVGGPQCLLHKA